MSQEATQLLKGPALGLKITAGLGIVATIASVAMNILGVGIASAESGSSEDAFAAMFSGGLAVVFGVIAIGIGVFIWIGAQKMLALQSYGLCMAAAIVAMIPCISPCCLLGLPIGIWAIVILVKPEVKEAFNPQL